MTVKELVNAAPFCDALEIVVREHGSGKWIQGYRISKYAEQWRYEHTVELQEIITQGTEHTVARRKYVDEMPRFSPGEIRDVIHSNNLKMRIIKKDVNKLPEYIANLNVRDFQPRHIPSFHKEQTTHNDFSLDINCYPEGFNPAAERDRDEECKKAAERNDNKEIDGQISIFDLMETGDNG